MPGHKLRVALFSIHLFAVIGGAQEYSFRFYGPAEGLQNLVVLSLAQDHSGYLWVGTEGGLYRYDGTRFRLMGQPEGLPCSTEVHGLFAAADGAIWVNTCAAIYRFDGKRFARIADVHMLLRGVQVMADGLDGSVWIAASTGLFEAVRAADGSFSVRSHPLPPQLAGRPMAGILREGPRMWFGCAQQLCREESGQVSILGPEVGLPQDKWDGIQVSPDGSVWIRSARALYRREPGQSRFSQVAGSVASSGFWGVLISSHDGSMMVPTDRGLSIYAQGRWSVIDRQHGLRKENVATVLQDREGSVWIGLAGGGLARWLGRGVWESWRVDQGLPSDIVWNIRRDKSGAMWVATSLGLVRFDTSGRTRTWKQNDGLAGDNIRWLAGTSDGSLWAVAKPGGLSRIDPVSGKVQRISRRDGLPCDPEDVFVDHEGRLWLPTGCGLYLNQNPVLSNNVHRVDTPESLGRTLWKIVEDVQGTIWTTNGRAMWSLSQGQWRRLSREDGLLTDCPYAMAVANDGSIWLRHRYDPGIDRLEVSKGRILHASVIVPSHAKEAGTAFHGFDVLGNFWRGSTNGVSVLHDHRWTTFSTEDGLVSNDCDGEAFWADADGGVWLGTSGGLAHYRPARALPPQPLSASPTIVRLQVSQAARLVQVEFSSLNYKAEQLVRFAYRLNNGPWTDSVDRSMSISGLGPGIHRLEVRCRVREEPCSPQIAAADFRLDPRWSETWWARLLAVVCGISAVMQFVRWRLTVARKRHAELESLVVARTANLRKTNLSLDDTARQLRRSEDRLKNAERLAHVGHWDWDLKTNQFSWSEEMYRIFDLPLHFTPDYDGFLRSVAPQWRERFKQWIGECLATKTGQSLEFQILRSDGNSRILICTSELSLQEDGTPGRLFGACQDVTEVRRTQMEDLARQKLESLGTLAGGIAHDFNNLLGGVVAQAELALTHNPSDEYPREELTAIRNVAIRGSEIVRQLMLYAGKDTEVSTVTDVSSIVAEMLELLKLIVSKRATLLADLDVGIPPVRAGAAQVRQIIMNLVTNASEAIGDRNGVIRIRAQRVPTERIMAGAKTLPEAEYVQLEISDQGCGMSPETVAKVFDPFFSTKGAGRGLGLAIVDGIVRGLHGAIEVASSPDHGTTFHILLPAVQFAANSSSVEASAIVQFVRPDRKTTVLVVEDEEPLRRAVVKLLRKSGFSVLEAANGTVAIDLLRANGTNVNVIFLDMTIPGAPSHEVVSTAGELYPEIAVVLTSAYSREMLAASITSSQIQGFIRKPYQFKDLAETIQLAVGSQAYTQNPKN